MRIRILFVSALLVAGCSKPDARQAVTMSSSKHQVQRADVSKSQQADAVSRPNLAQVSPVLPALKRAYATPWTIKVSTDDNEYEYDDYENNHQGYKHFTTLGKESLDGHFDLAIDLVADGSVLGISLTNLDCTDYGLFRRSGMHTRIEFDDGLVQAVDWVDQVYRADSCKFPSAELLLYPAAVDSPIGLLSNDQGDDWNPWRDLDGQQQLGQGMNRMTQALLAHKEALFEIKPGVTTQFDLTGLSQAYAAGMAADQKAEGLTPSDVAEMKKEEAEEEAKNKQEQLQDAREEDAEKKAMVANAIGNLNVLDVLNRCGPAADTHHGSNSGYVAYNDDPNNSAVVGNKYARVVLFFDLDDHFVRAEAYPQGSSQSQVLDSEALANTMPCLVNGTQ